MKNIIVPGFLLICLSIIIWKLDYITNNIAKLTSSRPTATVDPANTYSYDNDYLYVQKSQDFVPYSKQDIMNIFYSILDNGYESFTFYCPSEYDNCLKDVEEISNNQTIMTDIGNFVHPYNNFTHLKVVTDSFGQVDVLVTKMYDSSEIRDINDKVDKILKETVNDEMALEDKVLAIHDYIINFASYDEHDKSSNSGNAYGALIEGISKCAGYADALSIILARLNIKNFKVASKEHVWNAVYINDTWSQIDLTWDDPIVENGATITDTIRHKFYMIDTPTLLSYDTLEHNFDDKIYLEVRPKK